MPLEFFCCCTLWSLSARRPKILSVHCTLLIFVFFTNLRIMDVQELAVVLMKPSTAVFKEVPENSGCYQPSEHACVQADSVDVEKLFWALGVVVAKAVCGRACFPLPFTKCAAILSPAMPACIACMLD
jgi:hypothetical protein